MKDLITLVVAILASLVDYIWSALSSPVIRLKAWRSIAALHERGADQHTWGVYSVCLQNDEAHPVEWPRQSPLRLRIAIRGGGSFLSVAPGPFQLYAGATDEVEAYWTRRGREAVIEIPRMRPFKTWVVRCYVDGETDELEATLTIPEKDRLRRLLQRVSDVLFAHRPGQMNEQRVVVRRREDERYSAGSRSRLQRRAMEVSWYTVLAALILWSVDSLLLRVGYASLGTSTFELRLAVSAGCVALLFVSFWWLRSLADRDLLPLAQGYQTARQLEIVDSPPRERS